MKPVTQPAGHSFRVVAPPPVLFFGSFAVGVTLNAFWPLPLHVPVTLAALGAAAAGAGVLLALWAALTFRRAGTALEPGTAAAALVTHGPYQWSRNPIYVGMAAVCAGLALVVSTGWVLLALAPALVAVHFGVILREEHYLSQRFPHDYPAYQARVRRWI